MVAGTRVRVRAEKKRTGEVIYFPSTTVTTNQFMHLPLGDPKIEYPEYEGSEGSDLGKEPEDKQPESNDKDVHVPKYRGSMYLRSFVQPKELTKKIDLACRALRPMLDKFDAIAFTGMSGALIAPSVARALGKEVIMVRKGGQSSHSGYLVEGDYNARRYIILDDFRSSGETEYNIIRATKTAIPDAKYMGFLGCTDLTEFDVQYAEENNKPIALQEISEFAASRL